MSGYPDVRLRRLRRTEAIRRLVAETALSPSDLVCPLFVTHGRGVKSEIEYAGRLSILGRRAAAGS